METRSLWVLHLISKKGLPKGWFASWWNLYMVLSNLQRSGLNFEHFGTHGQYQSQYDRIMFCRHSNDGRVAVLLVCRVYNCNRWWLVAKFEGKILAEDIETITWVAKVFHQYVVCKIQGDLLGCENMCWICWNQFTQVQGYWNTHWTKHETATYQSQKRCEYRTVPKAGCFIVSIKSWSSV